MVTIDGMRNAYSLPAAHAQVKKTADKSSELYKVSVEFEALFIKQMLDVMRKTVKKEGLLNGGMSEEIFEDMLYVNSG